MNILKFTDLFEKFSKENFLTDPTTFFFITEAYPFSFLKEFFRKLEVLYPDRQIRTIDCQEQSLSQLMSLLETTFLGQSCFYILKLSYEAETKTQTPLLKYIQAYKGPHTLFISVKPFSCIPQDNQLFIEIPTLISLKEYDLFYSFFYRSEKNSVFSQALFKQRAQITLEQSFLLMAYQQLIGKNIDFFFKEYLDLLVVPQESLFLLSQYFFAKQSKKYFITLGRLQQVYPLEFWIVFWLEQIWQAIIFVQAATTRNVAVAKTLVSRLPFSFTQKDWKNYNLAELTRAHYALYEFDYKLKNGSSDLGLDLWYTSFLAAGRREVR